MQAVTWSPELHTIVRNFKKLDRQDIVSLLKNRKFALSSQEEQAVAATFAKPEVQQVRTLGAWG